MTLDAPDRIYPTTCVLINHKDEEMGVDSGEMYAPCALDLARVQMLRPYVEDSGDVNETQTVVWLDADTLTIQEPYAQLFAAWVAYRRYADASPFRTASN